MWNWIGQHFLNPAFALPGAALILAPIIIHLLNRLRYRKVRFAAMEFLLASQKRNRQRIFFEQLLLLLLRILLVLLVVALIGRLVLNADELSLFRGAQAHHVVILDDSASMYDRTDETIAFETAKKVLQRIVAEGAQRPGAQKITVLLASRPTESLSGLTERDIDEGLLTEIADRLPLMECTHQAFDPAKSLQAVLERLADDRTSLRYVHVLSDFRKRDWLDNEAAIAALEELSTDKVGINLVRCVGEQHENLSLTDLQGEVAVAAAGVPVTFRAEVANNGTREVKDVRAQILIDGNRLPRTLDFGDIAANETSERRFDVVFDIAKLHRLQVRLDEDALVTDDTRYMAVDVPVENPVLIVDGSPSGEQALYLADALAADKSVTGFAPEIRPATDLRRIPLDRFHIVYLVNVPELPPDAIDAVKKYVESGGGLVWYLGPNVNAVSYNQTLFADSGLFPTKLALAPTALEHTEDTEKSPDIVVGTHPMFEVFAGAENPLIDLVSVNLAFEPDADTAIDERMLPETEVLATLRDKRPLVLLHRVGQGQVLTCLTSAGPVKTDETTWTNWANGPGKISFVVFQLELARAIARRDRTLPSLVVGQPIEERLNSTYYIEDVEIATPDNQVTRLKAVAEESDEATEEGSVAPLVATYRDTDMPGVYGVTRYTRDQEAEQTLVAYNVPTTESELTVATDDALQQQLVDVKFEIQPVGQFDWIRTDSPGSEMRRLLILAICLIGAFEQFMAYRLSYH